MKLPVRRVEVLFVLASLLVATSRSLAGDLPRQPLTPVPVEQVTIQDDFWSPKLKLWQAVTVRDCFAKFAREGTFTNFDRVRAGQTGGHNGPPWYDGLVYQMIRAASDFLISQPDPELQQQVNGYVRQISRAAAGNPGGYLKAAVDFALDRDDYGPELRRWLVARLGLTEKPLPTPESISTPVLTEKKG